MSNCKKKSKDLVNLKLELISDYTNEIMEKLYKSNISCIDSVKSHIEKVFIDYDKKIRELKK